MCAAPLNLQHDFWDTSVDTEVRCNAKYTSAETRQFFGAPAARHSQGTAACGGSTSLQDIGDSSTGPNKGVEGVPLMGYLNAFPLSRYFEGFLERVPVKDSCKGRFL